MRHTPTRPQRCPRCAGLLVEEEPPAEWYCVNCGARGEGMELWGSVVGWYDRAVHVLKRRGVNQQHTKRTRNKG